MKKFLIVLKWAAIALLCVLVALLIAGGIGSALNRRCPEGGINESAYVEINGSKQWINIYGKDRNNPVLLYLHGGPGSATSTHDYAFTRKWSDVYTVVTWDQRGCGKSYDKSRPQIITAEIMMQDGKEMTEYLRNYLQVDRITLLGHSWGSYFGANLALRHPEYYEAFIGTGQCIDIEENERRLYEAALEWSENDPEGREMVEKWSRNMMDADSDIVLRNSIMKRYGYGMMKDGTDYNLLTTLLFNPNFGAGEYVSFLGNLKESLRPYMDFWGSSMAELSLLGKYDYAIPFYNIDGDMDYQTNFELACEYFRQVNAPAKRMFVMKNATHGLLESRSEEFSAFIHEIAALQR